MGDGDDDEDIQSQTKKNAWKLYTFLQKFEKNLTNADLRGKTREKSNKKLKFQEFFSLAARMC